MVGTMDSSCTHPVVTPGMAAQLVRRGYACGQCKPFGMMHGKTLRGGGICEWVDVPVVIVHRGLEFRQVVRLYVYDNGVGDIMLPPAVMENIPCVTIPGRKFLDLEWQEEDLGLLQQLAARQDVEVLEEISAEDREMPPLHPVKGVMMASTGRAVLAERLKERQEEAEVTRLHEMAPAKLRALIEAMEARRQKLRTLLTAAHSPEAQAAAFALMDEYSDVFSADMAEACDLGIFRIKLKDGSKCVVALPRRTAPLVLEDMRRQCEELLAAGIIRKLRPGEEPTYVSPVVMVRNPNKPGFRMCQDLRELNSNTFPAAYAMPELSHTLDMLSGRRMYCSFDARSFFNQFKIHEDDQVLTAFIVPGDIQEAPEIYCYTRICFGLTNAPFFTQRALQQALAKTPGCEGIINWIDDIVFGADDTEEMLTKLRALLEFCRSHKLKLKREKSQVAVRAVTHLGFCCHEGGQDIHPDRVDALMRFRAPTNIRELRHVLGAFGFVRNWLAGAANIAAPLTDMLKGEAIKAGFKWGEEQDAALDRLKLAALIAPVKVAPDRNKPFRIYCDASRAGVGAVLVQDLVDPEDGQTKPFAVSYASRRFSEREMRWCIGEQELYAVRYALEKFQPIIALHPDVTVFTDHANLLHVWSLTSAKITRWRLAIQQYMPFKIVHVAGKDNPCADALSRIHISNLTSTEAYTPIDLDDEALAGNGGNDDAMMQCSVGEFMSTTVTAQMCQQAGENIEDISVVGDLPWLHQPGGGEKESRRTAAALLGLKKLLESGKIVGPETVGPGQLKEVLCEAESMQGAPARYRRVDPEETAVSLHRAAVMHKAEQTERISSEEAAGQTDSKVFAELRKKVIVNRRLIELCHNEDVGHLGVDATFKRVVRASGFPSGTTYTTLREEVKTFCAACVVCQKLRAARTKKDVKLGFVRKRPFEEIAMDLIVLPSADADGHRYILTVVDAWSRAVELFALQTADASTVVQHLHDVYCRWGKPYQVRSDNGAQFISFVVKLLNERARVQTHPVVAYSHQSNGLCERTNQTVLKALRAMVLSERLGPQTHLHWGRLLPQVRRLLMRLPNARLGTTPQALAYMNCEDAEASLFEDEPWLKADTTVRTQAESSRGGRAAIAEIDAWQEQHQVLREECENFQSRLLQEAAARVKSAPAVLQVGDFVLAQRGDGRPKIGAAWTGPWLVLDRIDNDPAGVIVQAEHLASKVVRSFHMNMLKMFDISLLDDVADAAPIAALDSWEYEVAEVLEHRTVGGRGKKALEFLVLWKDLPQSEEAQNPSWEPYSTVAGLRQLDAYAEKVKLKI